MWLVANSYMDLMTFGHVPGPLLTLQMAEVLGLVPTIHITLIIVQPLVVAQTVQILLVSPMWPNMCETINTKFKKQSRDPSGAFGLASLLI